MEQSTSIIQSQENQKNPQRDYSLFPSQYKILTSNKDVVVAICGRGAGKTHAASHWVVKKMSECFGMGLIVAPTYKQAEIVIKYVTNILSDLKIRHTYNKLPAFGPFKSTLPNHNNILSCVINGVLRQVRVGSADQPDNLRGSSYSWMLLDEAAFIDEDTYATLMPCLRGQGSKFQYQQLLTTTPRGRNWVYNLANAEMKNIEVIRAASAENWIEYNDEKLEILKTTMSKRMYEQEILGQVADITDNAIYYAFSQKNIIKRGELPQPQRIVVSCDQNISPLCAVICDFRPIKTGGDNRSQQECCIIDEVFIPDNGDVKQLARALKKQLPSDLMRLEVYGDRYGNSRSVIRQGETFYSTLFDELRSLGFVPIDRTNNANPPVYDSAEQVNRMFEQGTLKISDHCRRTLEHIQLCQYKPNTLEPDKRATVDGHLADALRYCIWAHRPTQGPRLVGLH